MNAASPLYYHKDLIHTMFSLRLHLIDHVTSLFHLFVLRLRLDGVGPSIAQAVIFLVPGQPLGTFDISSTDGHGQHGGEGRSRRMDWSGSWAWNVEWDWGL